MRVTCSTYLIPVHDVERPVLERPRFVHITRAHVQTARPCALRRVLHELESGDLPGQDTDASPDRVRPLAVVAADVQQERVGIRRERIEQLRAASRLGVGRATLQRAPEDPPSRRADHVT